MSKFLEELGLRILGIEIAGKINHEDYRDTPIPAAEVIMPDPDPLANPSEIRRRALSRWENEGGALASMPNGALADIPDMTNTELVQLRIRVIALENLMIAILAEGTDRQLLAAREMADYISPRPGFTQHPLTIQAADHMTDLADRAIHFQTVQPQKAP